MSEQFTVDFTEEARAGRLPAPAQRDAEVAQTVAIMLRQWRNCPVLLGASGVGKTSVIKGLAVKIAAGEVPQNLRDKRLMGIDLPAVQAASESPAQALDTFRRLVEGVLRSAGQTILAVTDVRQLSDPEVSRLIRPHVVAGTLRIIAESDMANYKLHMETDPSLMRRLQGVQVVEPSADNAAAMVMAAKENIEQFHHISIDEAMVKKAVGLSARYVRGAVFPEKALGLLDDAAVAAALSGAPALASEHLAHAVAVLTGVPLEQVSADERAKLTTMEDFLKKRVIGQDEAVEAVSVSMRRSRSGLQDPNRPIGTFFFIGTTGVGKTELTKALAEFMFDDDTALTRLDMSEYMERSSVASLIGPPPGTPGFEQGGLLTEAVRMKPYQVLLFDELEKAHPEILNLLLQVLDEGRLTDARGVKVDFRNTIIILTSNLAADVPSYKRVEALSKYLRPEFLNRIDDIISFNSLNPDDMLKIVDIHLSKTLKRAKSLGIALSLAPEGKQWFVDELTTSKMGVRALKRLILHEIENKLANLIMNDLMPADRTVIFAPDAINQALEPRDAGGAVIGVQAAPSAARAN